MTNTLREIEERCEKATPKPWHISVNADSGQRTIDVFYQGGMGAVVLKAGVWEKDEDLRFIAHARSDIPYLLSLLKRCYGSVGYEIASRGNALAAEADKASFPAEYFRKRITELEALQKELGK
jgi:hypothetical protein